MHALPLDSGLPGSPLMPFDRFLRVATAAFALTLAPLPVHPAPAEPDRPAPSDRRRALDQAIDEIVARTPLHAARAGIVVASLDSGEVLYARDPDTLLNPASNVKLFTSAAVLARLGPEYRFDTEIYADGAPSGGAVKTLYVKGKGDPTFVTERLWALAGDIAHRGVKVVKGDLLVDDSFFDGQREGPGYDQERGDRSYLAPVGALSLNYNVVAIHVAPGARAGDRGRVELEPASDYLEIDNRTKTVRPNGRRRVTPSSVRLPNGHQRIVVDARLPAGSRDQVFYRKIDDPPLYFGSTLKRLLELRGVRVTGQVRRATVPASARLLLVAQSDSLAEVVRKLDKTSNNFVAEQLLKTLGAEKKGLPGTWPKGVEAVEDFLAEAGIPRGSYVMKNGSGLNDSNRFSARQTVTLLREVWRRFPIMADFLAALPVAGKDGTTRWRMESTEGRLRAKTGTLENVTSLSGFVETAARERLVFSILVNDFPGRAHNTIRAIDAVGSALAAAGGNPADLGAAVASATPPPSTARDEDAADVKAHLATYYSWAAPGTRATCRSCAPRSRPSATPSSASPRPRPSTSPSPTPSPAAAPSSTGWPPTAPPASRGCARSAPGSSRRRPCSPPWGTSRPRASRTRWRASSSSRPPRRPIRRCRIAWASSGRTWPAARPTRSSARSSSRRRPPPTRRSPRSRAAWRVLRRRSIRCRPRSGAPKRTRTAPSPPTLAPSSPGSTSRSPPHAPCGRPGRPSSAPP